MTHVSLSRPLLLATVSATMLLTWSGALTAQPPGGPHDHSVLLLDNCDHTDDEWDTVGGCPEGDAPGLRSYRGDVTLDEFNALLESSLPPGHLVGHPSWHIESSYAVVHEGESLGVTNRGGRTHTFTEVTEYGGGFIPPLNVDLTTAPECGTPGIPASDLLFLAPRESARIDDLELGLHLFQCCIHPWMRTAIRVEE